MSAVAAPRSGRARAARRAPVRVSVTSALLILACAAVLIGIVTLQVAVLQLNSELRGRLGGKLAPGVLAARAIKAGLVLPPVELRQTGSLGH